MIIFIYQFYRNLYYFLDYGESRMEILTEKLQQKPVSDIVLRVNPDEKGNLIVRIDGRIIDTLKKLKNPEYSNISEYILWKNSQDRNAYDPIYEPVLSWFSSILAVPKTKYAENRDMSTEYYLG